MYQQYQATFPAADVLYRSIVRTWLTQMTFCGSRRMGWPSLSVTLLWIDNVQKPPIFPIPFHIGDQ